MSEAEILELRLETIQATLAVVSVFFTVITAYIAALYFFLQRAPWLLKATAFLMVTGGVAFLAIISFNVERIAAGLVSAWNALPDRSAQAGTIDFPLLSSLVDYRYSVLIFIGASSAALVYVALFYMTFLHPWAREKDT